MCGCNFLSDERKVLLAKPICNSTGPEHSEAQSWSSVERGSKVLQRQEGNGRDLLGYEGLFSSLTERLILKITIPLHLAGM